MVVVALACTLTACKSGDAPAPPNITTDRSRGNQLTDDATPATIFGDLLIEDWD
jgi:hypothetical protein